MPRETSVRFDKYALRQKVQHELERRGWTVAKFLNKAKEIGAPMSPQTYYNVLRGDSGAHFNHVRYAFRRLINVSLDDFLVLQQDGTRSKP